MRPILVLLLLAVTLTAQAQPEASKDTVSSDTEPREPWSIAVALSGGAALGFAHIGVLKVLEEEGIPISYISGTSMGSIVAGMYAAGYSAADMDSILTTVDWDALFSDRIPQNRMSLPRREELSVNMLKLSHKWFVPQLPTGVVSLQNVEILLTDLFSEIIYDANYNFDSLTIPFRCVAADVSSGEKVVFKKGSMAEAIRASIAIPAVFSPAKLGDKYYIDGGVVQNLPVEPLEKFKPNFIIASDVIRWTSDARNIIDVVTRTTAIVTESNRKAQRKRASVVLYPNVDKFLPSDFSHAKELVAAGEAAARRAMPDIKEKLDAHPLVLKRNPLRYRPRPVVSAIRFEGLKITRENLIKGLILMQEGDTIDFKKLVSDMESLRETGLFSHVSHRLEFADSSVQIIYTLEEKEPGFYGFSLHYCNTDGFAVRTEVAQNNLFGLGAKLSLSAVLGEPKDIRVGLSGARLGRLPFMYRLEAYRNGSRHAFYQKNIWRYNYQMWTWGVDAEFGCVLWRFGYATLGYEHRRHVLKLPAFAKDTTWLQTISGPSFKLKLSTLDDFYIPTRGFNFVFSGKLGLAIPSFEEEFMKTRLQTQVYFPFGNRLVLGAGFDIGLCADTLPRVEKFRLGGESLYGAKQDQLEVYDYLKFRMFVGYRLANLMDNPRYPVRIEWITDLAYYIETIGKDEEASIIDAFLGAGLGCSLNTPVGPLKASVGFASSKTIVFNVSAGIPLRERM